MYIEDDSSGIPYPVEDYLFIHYYSFKYCAFDDKLALDILSEQQMAEKRGRDREDEARKRRDPVNRQQREEKLSDSNAETEIGKQ